MFVVFSFFSCLFFCGWTKIGSGCLIIHETANIVITSPSLAAAASPSPLHPPTPLTPSAPPPPPHTHPTPGQVWYFLLTAPFRLIHLVGTCAPTRLTAMKSVSIGGSVKQPPLDAKWSAGRRGGLCGGVCCLGRGDTLFIYFLVMPPWK